jgi:hypothetical protein
MRLEMTVRGRWAAGQESLRAVAARQASLLPDIFGRLSFRPVALDPAWTDWNSGIVIRLARVAYDERRLPEGTLEPGRLALLADALEDAGCIDADLLGHLRSPGPPRRSRNGRRCRGRAKPRRGIP